jgi:CDP-6-deoxy-D-xylo-4-hexulose-3-dehydrase
MKENSNITDFLSNMAKTHGSIPKFMHNNNTSNSVYYSGPYYDENELYTIIETILLGEWFSAGKKVHEFENSFSEKFNLFNSVMVNSGSSANLIMIAALKKYFNWEDNDEVILSAVGFPTTLSAIIVNKLTPVFVDIEFDTLNFNINLIEEKITKKTKAIFVSPVLGNPPNFDYLIELCDKYNIQFVLDNCDSLGSKWKDKYLSEYSIASSCSFYPAHHITTGEGGMISSYNKDIIKIAKSMVTWGRDCTCTGIENLLSQGSCNKRFDKWLPEQDVILDHKYIFTNIGYNLKPLDFQGAIGTCQLNKIDDIITKRINHKNKIQKILEKNLKGIRIINDITNSSVSWFGIPIVCDSKEIKVNLVKQLEKNKIQTRNYFAGNILLHPAYKHLDDWKKYSNSNRVLEEVFFLGCSPNYTEKTFEYIDNITTNIKL